MKREWCYFGPWRYDVDKAAEIIVAVPRKSAPFPVARWAEHRGFTLPEGSAAILGPGPSFDPAYAMTTDLTRPLLFATLREERLIVGESFPVHSRFLVDGTHRLYRAWREGMAELPGWVLTVEETLSIRSEL